MTNTEAIECNKNLKEYMRISDKTSEYKFLEDNYIALEMGIKALELLDTLTDRPCSVCKHKADYCGVWNCEFDGYIGGVSE